MGGEYKGAAVAVIEQGSCVDVDVFLIGRDHRTRGHLILFITSSWPETSTGPLQPPTGTFCCIDDQASSLLSFFMRRQSG